jgi:DNA-3-methyladenine glycosylase I
MHPYCAYVSKIKDNGDVDKLYHDHHYGVRIEDDNELFGRLVMEINQAGLSWRTILMKEKGFRKAYHNFEVSRVAKYKEKDIERLLQDASIIRNKLKIHAAIYNAQAIVGIQKEYGSMRSWLDKSAPELKYDSVGWLTLFKKHFKFVGGEIVGEFLMSINLIPGSHDRKCVAYKNVIG